MSSHITNSQSAQWTQEKAQTLADFVVAHYHASGAEEGTMKKEQWQALSGVIGGMTPVQCKNKWGDMKLKYSQWKELERQPDFGWNEERKLYEAAGDVWDNMNQQWKNIVWHKTHVLQCRKQLDTVLAGSHGAGVCPQRLSRERPRSPRRAEKRRASPHKRGRERKRAKEAAAVAFQLSRMADILEEFVKQRAMKMEMEKSKPERAVQLAESLYRGRMSAHDRIKLYELFEDESKAGVFLIIKGEKLRDHWLMKNTNAVIHSTNQASEDREKADENNDN